MPNAIKAGSLAYYQSASAEETKIVSSGPVDLYYAQVTIEDSADADSYFFQVWDGGTSGTLLLELKIRHTADGSDPIGFTSAYLPIHAATSLTFAVSETAGSFDDAAGDIARFYAQYQEVR